MNYVKIEPCGLFAYKWDGEIRKYRRKRVRKDRVLTHLRTHCKIKAGTTLRDIFRVVESYRLLKSVISQYSWCSVIDEMHAQAEEPTRSEPDGEPIDYLEIHQHVPISSWKPKGKDRVVSADRCVDFHGVGRVLNPEAWEGRFGYQPPPDGIQTYSVSCTPMYDLADLPVRLNERMDFLDMRSRKQGPPTARLVLSTMTTYSLLEVLDAIYWDLSFYGSPADSAEFIARAKNAVEDYLAGKDEPDTSDD